MDLGLKFKPNLFNPRTDSIEADRLRGPRSLVYILPEKGRLELAKVAHDRELTFLSIQPTTISIRLKGRTVQFDADMARRLFAPALSEIQIPQQSQVIVREEQAPFSASLQPAQDLTDTELALLSRASPARIRFWPNLCSPNSPYGLSLFPNPIGGTSEALFFSPDQHFQGQFKLHPRADSRFTILTVTNNPILIEAIDLRTDSPSRMGADAILFQPTPRLSIGVPAGVAYRIQCRDLLILRNETEFYSEVPMENPDYETIWLGVGLNWPTVEVPKVKLCLERV